MVGDILQPTHLLFILVIALLVLGPKRLPEAGRALGRGLRDFKNALNTDELRDQMVSTTTYQSTTPLEQEPIAPTETPVATEPVAVSTDDSDQPASPPEAPTEVQQEPVVSAPAPERAP